MCLRFIFCCFFPTYEHELIFTIEKSTNNYSLDTAFESPLINDIIWLRTAYDDIFYDLYSEQVSKSFLPDFFEVYNEDQNAFKYSTNFNLKGNKFEQGAILPLNSQEKKSVIRIIFDNHTLVVPKRICLAKFIWIVGRCMYNNWSTLKEIEELIASYENSTSSNSNNPIRIKNLKTFLQFLESAQNKKLKKIDQILKDVILSYLKHYKVSDQTLQEFKKLKFDLIFECSEEVLKVIKDLDFEDLIEKIFDAREQAFLKFCE